MSKHFILNGEMYNVHIRDKNRWMIRVSFTGPAVMALPYEALNADQRLAERAARKQWLEELPRSSDEQGFFKEFKKTGN